MIRVADYSRYKLTTAHILYHMPDHPALLQSYIWQEVDMAPEFPVLRKFIEFWLRELEGRLHSVEVTESGLFRPAEFRFSSGEFIIH